MISGLSGERHLPHGRRASLRHLLRGDGGGAAGGEKERNGAQKCTLIFPFPRKKYFAASIILYSLFACVGTKLFLL